MRLFSLLFIIVFFSVSGCFAQDWDTFLNNYDKNQISNPVTPQEFENAINTVKGIQNQNKKIDKKKKTNKIKNQKGNELAQPLQPVNQIQNSEFIVPSSTGMLLRLPVNVVVNGQIFSDGFYLVEKISRDKKYYLKLMQSGKTLAEVETQISQEKYTGFSQLLVNNKGKFLELLYIDREISLKAELSVDNSANMSEQ